MSLSRVVDGATIGIAVATQSTVPGSAAASAAVAEPLHHPPLLAGGRVDQAVLWLTVLTLLPQRFLLLQENGFVWTSGHSISFYN